MTIAYSYVRFSSERQSLGDGLRRQLKLAEDYATEHKLTLNTSTYRDLGISALKGKNAAEGALAAFLDAVDAGVIPKGSVLLVEALDRLSRAQVDHALELFLCIIRRGITIVTLKDRQSYSQERIKQDKGMSLIISITQMMLAHEESARKGKRVKAAWDAKRASGKPMTRICPPWLAISDDRSKYIVLEEKAAQVRSIFQSSADGVGVQTLARRFNDPKTPTPVLANGKKWEASVLGKLLHNQAVIGTMVSPRTGEISEGYYPPIIDKELFYEVQAGIARRNNNGKGRKGANVANLLSGLGKCGKCRGPIRFVQKGSHAHLQCRSNHDGTGCDAQRWPYKPIEDRLLYWMLVMEGVELVPQRAAVDPRAALRDELTDKNARLERMMDAFEEDPESRAIRLRVKKMEADIVDLEKRIREYVAPPPLSEVRAAARDLYIEHTRAPAGAHLTELRTKMQDAVRKLCTQVLLLPSLGFIPDDTFYKQMVVYGPLVDLVLSGKNARMFTKDATEDGGIKIDYVLPQYGLDGSRRRPPA